MLLSLTLAQEQGRGKFLGLLKQWMWAQDAPMHPHMIKSRYLAASPLGCSSSGGGGAHKMPPHTSAPCRVPHWSCACAAC